MVTPGVSNAGNVSDGSYRVPRGHVWIEGDNLSNSTDSRRYGVVPESMVEGRCVMRVRWLRLRALFVVIVLTPRPRVDACRCGR